MTAQINRALRPFSAAARRASTLRHSKKTQLIGSFVAGALACIAVVTFAMGSAPAPVSAAFQPSRTAVVASASLSGQSRLDLLRNEAASGDEFSNWELTNALLDRYDLSGDSDELYEAMVWVDRRWDTSGRAELAARVVTRYCRQRVMQWHWLCSLGE
jgi:hypothetical protein